MITIHSLPELRAPVLLCAFNGWSDGSFASTSAVAYLLAKWESQRFAEVDPESIYVYTTTRPTSAVVAPGERLLRWPELGFHLLRLPQAEHDLVVVLGPEPDLRWLGCAEEIAQLGRRLDASLVVTLGCFLASVPHRVPVPLVGLSGDAEIRRRLERIGARETDYQGPTAFTTALVDAAFRTGLPAASLWAAAPAYLQGGSNPKIAAALLRGVESLLGVRLAVDELEAAGLDLEQRVDEALNSRPDLQRFVSRLAGERVSTAAEVEESEAPAEPAELPSPKEFLAQMEDYLRGLQSGGSEGGEPRPS